MVRGKVVWVLFRGIVPRDEVEVAVDGGVPELVGVANDGVEVAFGWRDEVCVVHEDGSGEVVPTPDAEVDERAR